MSKVKKTFLSQGEVTVSKFFTTPSVEKKQNENILDGAVLPDNTVVTDKTDNTVVADSTDVQNKSKNKYRFNFVYEKSLADYAQLMARLDNVSHTEYIVRLIKKDMLEREKEYEEARKLFKI